jgi:hypothetical protein
VALFWNISASFNQIEINMVISETMIKVLVFGIIASIATIIIAFFIIPTINKIKKP